MGRLDFLEGAQWWTLPRTEAYQSERLHQLVQDAWEVPFYRNLWKQAWVDPGRIRTIEDLPQLPRVTKEELRASFPHDVTRPAGLPVVDITTSGSTAHRGARFENAGRSASHALACLGLGWLAHR